MQTATCNQRSENGHAVRESTPTRTQRLASRGVRTYSDISRAALAVFGDMASGRLDTLDGVRLCSALNTSIRADLHKRLVGADVVLDDGLEDESVDPLAAEEARLLEQLAAVRKERASQ